MSLNKKILLGTGLFVLLFVVIIVVFRSPARPHLLYQSPVLARNIEFPTLKNNVIRYFTGTAFVEYDPTNNTGTSLTKEFILPDMIDIVWGENEAYFVTSPPESGDSLFDLLPSEASDRIWWHINFDAGRIGPAVFDLGNKSVFVEDIAWADEDSQELVAVGASPGDNKRYILSSDSGGRVRVINELSVDSSLNILFANSEKLYLQRGLSALLVTKNNISELLPNALVLGVSESGGHVVYKEHQPEIGKPRSLLVYSVENDESKILLENHTDQALGFKGEQLIIMDGGISRGSGYTFTLVDLTNLDKTSVEVGESGQGTGRIKSIFPVNVLEAVSFWATNENDELMLFSLNPDQALSFESAVFVPFTDDSFSLKEGHAVFNASEDVLDIYLRGGRQANFDKQQKVVMAELKKLTDDPHQVRKIWHKTNFGID